ncbi:MAG: NAD(P)H-hydrate dehydratase [Actinomycetota bacterium]
MKPVLTPLEAAALDRDTQARGISAESLMERAGREVARAAVAVAGGAYGRRAVVVCGKGNNGGDGLVAARHLARAGMRASIVVVEEASGLREPAATNLRRLDEVDVRVRAFSAEGLARELDRADVAVDAIFGTGFHGSPDGAFAEAIAVLNQVGAPVVAVDIPSGVNGETGAVEGEAVFADVTITLGAAKAGVVLFPGADRAGVVDVVDIGFPPDLVRADLWLVEEADVAGLLPVREPDAHKRTSGVVVVVGGSRSMTGAVCLAAEAAYRAGAGLVTVAVPEGILPVVQSMIAEATFLPLPETSEGTIAEEAASILAERMAGAGAVAIGPGMTTNEETARFLRGAVRDCKSPLVVDADALNAFRGRAAELAERRSEVVLTPHAGEFGRLAGVSSREVLTDRVGHVRKLAAETQSVVLLKGSRTLIASPDGSVRVNPTGDPVLATAGTGDVLTGTIAGLLARGLATADAAIAGAFVHGLAGQIAGRELGEGTTARDVLLQVARAVHRVRGR